MAEDTRPRFSRRRFLGGSAVVASGLGAAALVGACSPDRDTAAPAGATNVAPVAPALDFYGQHQNGIALPRQHRLVFGAFDAIAPDRDRLVQLLRKWTDAGAALADGSYQSSTGEADGLATSRLTLTFGFGATLFANSGADRYGLGVQRPVSLIDLPAFRGEQLDPVRSGGDLGVQICADDPTVAFHALHTLNRLASGAAVLRWTQTGFVSTAGPPSVPPESPRNLMGFRDGTNNLALDNPAELRDHLWVGDADGPAWMRGGTYLVARRIRIDLEQWDRLARDEQEAAFGRAKQSGAPLSGGTQERDPLQLSNERIASDAHVRLSAPDTNDGARMLRRSYSYFDDTSRNARGPESGLFFVSYQRDIGRQFVPIQQRLADGDALNAFTTHTASAVFAMPPGVAKGGFVGETLFSA
ncbi:MAG: Dyp-type peroxidase [Acidimicrobiia bacterium]